MLYFGIDQHAQQWTIDLGIESGELIIRLRGLLPRPPYKADLFPIKQAGFSRIDY